MENQLTTQDSTHQSLIVLNDREGHIAKIVYHVNQLVNFPLSSVQIEDWAKSINEYYATLDLDVLRRLIKDFKLGKKKWDYHVGIQNIFIALYEMGIYDDDTQQQIENNELDYNRRMVY